MIVVARQQQQQQQQQQHCPRQAIHQANPITKQKANEERTNVGGRLRRRLKRQEYEFILDSIGFQRLNSLPW
jgi:hypothetical protein